MAEAEDSIRGGGTEGVFMVEGWRRVECWELCDEGGEKAVEMVRGMRGKVDETGEPPTETFARDLNLSSYRYAYTPTAGQHLRQQ